VLVRAGRPVELPDHLARLDRSCREVYGEPLPDGVADDAWRRCGEIGDGVLRVLADGRQVSFRTSGPPPADPPHLVPVTRRYGSWRHPWVDRRWAAAAEAEAGPGRLPLLLDPAGGVAGTTRACVLIVEGDRLVTRPLDDDVLPGIARLHLLDEAAAAGVPIGLEPVPLDRLLAADAVLTADSLHGVRPVESVGRRRWPEPHPLGTDLAARLADRWAGTTRTPLPHPTHS
jgi:para-aminobenzoate synthetase/4-amino-4-deoxychorismate lyase